MRAMTGPLGRAATGCVLLAALLAPSAPASAAPAQVGRQTHLSTSGPAAATGNPTTHVLVMGDSYSAGNGAGNYAGPAGCWRSTKNYAGRFAALLRAAPWNQPASVTNVACSGAVTQDFFDSKSGRPPELSAVSSSYDLIFLTIGGNDVSFAKIVQNCLIQATRDGAKCDTLLTTAEKMIGNGTVGSGTIGGRLTRVLKAVRNRASAGAKIVLIGYPFLEGNQNYTLPKDSGSPVKVGKRLHALQVDADRLERAVANAVNGDYPGSPFAFVSVQSLFNGPPFHGLYAQKLNPDRWMVAPMTDATIASKATWYHPNPTGWDQEARLLIRTASVPHTPKPVIITTSLPDGAVGQNYSTQLTTADHRTGTWSVTSGTLPTGLTLSGYTIAGSPTQSGTRTFGLQFTDSYGRVATATASITIDDAIAAPIITSSTFNDQGIALTYTAPTGITPSNLVDYICQASPDGGATVYPCDSSDGYPSGVGTSDPATASDFIYYDPGYYQITPGWSIAMAAITTTGQQPFGPWYTITNNPLQAPTITQAVDGSDSLSVYFNPPPAEPGLTVQQYICEVSPDGGTTVYTCNGGADGTLGSMGLTSPASVPNTIYYDPGYYQIVPGWSIRMWAVASTVTSPKSDWVTIS